MTGPDPQARRDDDDGREHRTIGQRIRDAVLGDEPTDRRDDAGSAYVDPGHDPAPSAADTSPDYTTRTESGVTGGAAPAAAHIAADGLPGHTHTAHDTPESGYAGPGSGGVDSAHDIADHGYPGPGAGSPAADRGRYDRDPGYDDRTSTDRTHADRTYPDAPDDDVVRGDIRTDARDTVGDGTDGDRTVRDGTLGGGTIGGGTTAGATAAGATAASAFGSGSAGPGSAAPGSAGRDYDPTADTGYVDERRATVDATTGDRDADYDTGRVDATRPYDGPADGPTTAHRAAGTSSADTSSSGTSSAGAIAAGALAAGGAAVAAGVAAHRAGDDRDERDDRRSFTGGDSRQVGGTSTVDAPPTRRVTADSSGTGTAVRTDGDTGVAQRAEAVAADDAAQTRGGRERLVPADRADDYSRRWDTLKGDFVDEPRRAVAQADALVGEVLDDIQRLFSDQRRDLEQGLDHDQASTEDLRLALRRYRSFFDRLLSL